MNHEVAWVGILDIPQTDFPTSLDDIIIDGLSRLKRMQRAIALSHTHRGLNWIAGLPWSIGSMIGRIDPGMFGTRMK